MKKIVASALVAMTLCGVANANDLVDKMYFGAGVVAETATDNGFGYALALTAGLPIVENSDAFIGSLAIEVDLTKTLIPMETDSIAGGYAETDIMTFSVMGAWKYDINEQWYVKPRLGFMYAKSDFDFKGTYSGYSIGSQTETTVNVSVIGGYKVDKNLDITFGLYANDKIMPFDNYYQLGVGALYKF